MRRALQAKVLRVLEDRLIMRVGAVTPRQSDVRFVAATNRDLQSDIRAGLFRADLFYRLNGVTIPLSPLRHRPDLIALARAFAIAACAAVGTKVPVFSLAS